MASRQKSLSWTPVRKGETYCSPACGFSCTFADFELAKSRGAALVKRLGAGWKADVWENGGWHYAVYKGRKVISHHRGLVEIYPNHERDGSVSYWAALQTSPQFTSDHTETPEAALRQVLSIGKRTVRIMSDALAKGFP